jgi:hypothetical protein
MPGGEAFALTVAAITITLLGLFTCHTDASPLVGPPLPTPPRALPASLLPQLVAVSSNLSVQADLLRAQLLAATTGLTDPSAADIALIEQAMMGLSDDQVAYQSDVLAAQMNVNHLVSRILTIVSTIADAIGYAQAYQSSLLQVELSRRKLAASLPPMSSPEPSP